MIHAMAKGPRAVVGPTVLGRGNACSECWQLRSAAWPRSLLRPLRTARATPLLGPVLHAAAAIADELAAIIEDPFWRCTTTPSHTFDSTNRSSRRHALVRHPACSTCARYWAIQMPIARGTGDPDFSRIAETVVSPVCGIVMTVEPVNDIADGTAEPIVYWARLAATAAAHGGRVFPQAAGKGWTNDDASRSVLGESLERYCGLTWRATEIRLGRLSELNVPHVPPQSLSSLDDLDLGTDDSAIEWCPSTSITTGDTIWVPSQAVSLRQDPGPHERRRSNATGLAAGRNLADRQAARCSRSSSETPSCAAGPPASLPLATMRPAHPTHMSVPSRCSRPAGACDWTCTSCTTTISRQDAWRSSPPRGFPYAPPA